MNKLTDLTKKVADYYASDPSTASVTISWIKTSEFYASVCRYTERYGNGKQVVCKARHPDFDTCIEILSAVWTKETENLTVHTAQPPV